jgi:hypothetical protein
MKFITKVKDAVFILQDHEISTLTPWTVFVSRLNFSTAENKFAVEAQILSYQSEC